MDQLLLLLLLSSGLRAEGDHSQTGARCETEGKADIILLVDSSWSIGQQNFQAVRSFLAKVVSVFDIGPDRVQIGLAQFSGDVRTEWHLDAHQTKWSLLRAISTLPYKGGNTLTGLALSRTLHHNFKPHVGMRADSRKILVLITDGRSQDDVLAPSQQLKDTGVEIYAIGVKNSDRKELWAIASDPKRLHMYFTREFVFLKNLTDQLTINLCNSTNSFDSVRLVNGTSLCSGRLEGRFNQSNQGWSSVCEADFDQQDAEVVCRELDCAAPSDLQGALYGDVEAPMWTTEFECGGNESALLDCRSSASARTTCSPGKAVGLTCSEPVRLVGEASRCAGTVEVKRGQWRPASVSVWTLREAAVACRELDCGSAVSAERRENTSATSVWWINPSCLHSGYGLRECASANVSSVTLDLVCSDLLVQPVISMSSSVDGVSEAQQQGLSGVFRGSDFNISCSIQPQYPGGFFQLTFTFSNTAHDYTQPAVHHSAHFLFPVADPAHQGNYSCVYHVHVFSHNFSSESCQLFLTVSDPPASIIRLVVLPLSLLLMNGAIYISHKATRGQRPGPRDNIQLEEYDLGVPGAAGVQAAE